MISMVAIPLRSRLYRKAGRLVISTTLTLITAVNGGAQNSPATKGNKGPRALGLIEMTNGKARLVPIVILIDGQYFDAGAYKADPVPMALWGDTVYEGIRTGVSQGLFTVKSTLENPNTHQWLGEGTWLPASAIHSKSPHKDVSSIPRGMNDDEGPPVLRHAGASKPKAPKPVSPTPTTASQPSPSQPAPVATAPAPSVAVNTPAPPSASAQPDKDIPILKRGIPPPKPPEPLTAPAAAGKRGSSAKAGGGSPTQVFPAISAENGPEPHPYTYAMTPEEEQQYRKKLLAMAADEVRSRAKLRAAEIIQLPERGKKPAPRSAAVKPVQPDFEDIQLRVFDLNSSNEPVMILSARARLPQDSKQSEAESDGQRYLVTVVARQDVNADFHKVFSNVTDTGHLDVIPQIELIDAVDVDGDGRGELLFREISDEGTVYAVYRVVGNQLYPLFQGRLGE